MTSACSSPPKSKETNKNANKKLLTAYSVFGISHGVAYVFIK